VVLVISGVTLARIAALQALPLLSQEEARLAVQTIRELRPFWHRLTNNHAGFQLGTASNRGLPPGEYARQAAETNPRLRASFSGLLERVRQALESTLQRRRKGPARFTEHHALPGFHVFEQEAAGQPFAPSVFGPHWDWNVYDVPWSPELPDDMALSEFASFTLPLELPSTGGGLHIWEHLFSSDVLAHVEEHQIPLDVATRRLAESRSPTFHPYEVGTLYMHTGHEVHQVKPWDNQPGEARITLQGHGVFHEGVWWLYW
jgi:hypothetical protein